MNKIFLLLTLLCLSLSARAHDAEVNGIFYNLDATNKTATVTFKGDNFWDDDEYYGDVVIPETVAYDGITYSVTSLGDKCRGVRPSLYISLRAISAPLRRPVIWTLMPSAPARMVFWIAILIARR